MGDVRFEAPYRRVAEAANRAAAIAALTNDEVVMALAGASREKDPLLANVLATEAMNRMRRAGVIAEHLGEGVFATDAENRVIFANPAALDALGYDRDEILGQTMHDFLHVKEEGGQPMPPEECAVLETLATGRTTHLRDHGDAFRRKDGSTFPVELTSAPIVREGDVVGAVVVFGDLTKEREAEWAMRRLAAIVESSDDAIVADSREGVITQWNAGAERLFGYAADDIIGQPNARLVPPDREEDIKAARRVVADGEAYRYETQRVRKDGALVDVAVTLSPLRERSGRIVGVSAIYDDIRERKRAEAERDRAEARLAAVLQRERELHATVRYRLTTLLPALAWGLGSIILFRTALLLWFAASPGNWNDGLVLATTTLALVVGGIVGVGVYAVKRKGAAPPP